MVEKTVGEDDKDSFYYKAKRWNMAPIYDELKQKYYVEVEGKRSDELPTFKKSKPIARSEIESISTSSER